MNCKCDDIRHDTLGTTIWHRAYCNWYDTKKARHTPPRCRVGQGR